MKLKTRILFCTSAIDTHDTNPSLKTSKSSPSLSSSSASSSITKSTSTESITSHLSLQTFPSITSLQTLSFSDISTTVTLTHSISFSHSLPSPVSFLSLSSSLLYVSSAHHINVYDSLTFSFLETFNSNGESDGAVKSIAFYDGKVLSAHQDGKIKVWKLTEDSNNKRRHKLIYTLPTLADRLSRFPVPKNHVHVRRHKTRLWVEHSDAVSSLAVTNGKVYSISWDKTLKVWDPMKNFKCKESITAHEDAINIVIVSNDGMVYTGSADGRIRVWGKQPGSDGGGLTLISTLEKHKSAVNALALNCEGSILFSGACDRSILVWEREDSGIYMSVIGAVRGHGGPILCLINVSDYLISGSADRTVRIWRSGFDGEFFCLSVLNGHKKAVKCLAGKMESDDRILLFSGGLDGEIKIWSVNINHDL
ncbi:protein JINGUBANG-like [Amaranthus tricolor]|uniref:protein JINGUBANG-like n=1 Tax=Amaranthus tricolor TaxID=29722 RepID=UPI0025902198|nr:protein JINGUBANG-like [Amaranthus tricolor]